MSCVSSVDLVPLEAVSKIPTRVETSWEGVGKGEICFRFFFFFFVVLVPWWELQGYKLKSRGGYNDCRPYFLRVFPSAGAIRAAKAVQNGPGAPVLCCKRSAIGKLPSSEEMTEPGGEFFFAVVEGGVVKEEPTVVTGRKLLVWDSWFFFEVLIGSCECTSWSLKLEAAGSTGVVCFVSF